MKAYALDLRERVVKFVNRGGSKAESARRFALGRRIVYCYLAAAQTGTLAPQKSWEHWRKLDPKNFSPTSSSGPTLPIPSFLSPTCSNVIVNFYSFCELRPSAGLDNSSWH